VLDAPESITSLELRLTLAVRLAVVAIFNPVLYREVDFAASGVPARCCGTSAASSPDLVAT
jgi:hypothetical protein